MFKKPLILLFLLIFFAPLKAYGELIVLATPYDQDSYYEDVLDDIIDFHIDYATIIKAHGDDVLILTNDSLYEDYVEALGAAHVIKYEMFDIWMRDFSLSNRASPILFRYSAAGQGGDQQAADDVQEAFRYFLSDMGIPVERTALINDGGNFVEDGHGNVVVSKKFLRDNRLREQQARERLQALPAIKQVAFIDSDEQGGLEHADGVVSFIDENTLIINHYPDDPDYMRQLKADLRRGLPQVKLHEMITAYDGSQIYDDRFGSACGIYTNALVTSKHIYFPQFGVPEDKIALQTIKKLTSRKVIPVRSDGICYMGGGVRCMSWQTSKDYAQKIRQYFLN